MQRIIDAEKSDLFDVLAPIAYAVPPETRAFHAHVTLGRVDGLARTIGRRVDAATARLPETPWLLNTLALIESRLLPQGAIHTVVEEAPLQSNSSHV